ncbi:oxidoreductase like protein [Zymoseptoria brevis]|uniref:Oxidoreductase like protein n=1 Tax=Zymoseptoria brevis TaxID=1047168 RepID=A0A0F4GGA3_9PEZI|nr:oxidoreductase like protein [Zymoseptoria brevis]
MAGQSFRYRTIVEVAVISIVIYIFLGAPGFPASTTKVPSIPKANSKGLPKVENLVYTSRELVCPPSHYDAHIYSTAPLLIYIENFLSHSEADHLISLSSDIWQPSTVSNNGALTHDPKVRLSEKAAIPRDRTVQCIESRALSFQGWPRDTFIEKLWTQRYNVSGHYALHYDWSSANPNARRVSSFMVYLEDGCEGGGTRFPKLKGRGDEKWCEFVDCGADEEGVTFKSKKGAAVFWRNFDDEGRGYKETVHAGMPVTKGTKIGLNVWSWYQAGHRAPDDVGEL